MRNKLLMAAALGAAATFMVVLESDARACGGCFQRPPQSETPSIVTDHRMILSVSKEQSTLYDQIKYQGNPSSFAWVLPISGTVDVGLSADIVFAALDGSTRTQIISPPQNCPPPPNCNSGFGGTSAAEAPSDAGAKGDVTVTKQEVVGPYLSVQLKATTPGALKDWLDQNGYTVPPDVQPVVDDYVINHFDFLALKLIPGKGVQDMRPVRVTTKGANAVLPLRMVAAGTGATVGITLWVVSEGRYAAANFPNFEIKADELVWDWTQQKSNYTTLRAERTTASSGRAWETESSTIVYPQEIKGAVLNGGYGRTGAPDPDGGTPLSAEERAARINYDPVIDANGVTTKTSVQVRDADLATLFFGIPTSTSRVTRMRADLAHAALNADLVMTASPDQSVLASVRQVTKEANQPLCTVYEGCSAVGQAPRDEAIARSTGNGKGESFSCATGGGNNSPLWLGAGLGYLAIAIAGARRRRRPS